MCELRHFHPEIQSSKRLGDQIAFISVRSAALPAASPLIVEADTQVGSPPLLHENSPFIVEADRQVGSPPSCGLPDDSPFIVEADRQVGSLPPA